jgi:Fe-S-cluster containining protein
VGKRRSKKKRRRRRSRTPRQIVVEIARRLADQKWASVRDLESAIRGVDIEPGLRVQCFGCKGAGCCKQLALCTTFEGVILADRLERENPVMLGRVLQQGRRQWEEWGKHGLADLEAKDATCTWWFDQDEFCALYVPGEGCAVYSDRPMTCATYFVVTPPELCGAQSGTKVGAVNNAQQCLDVMLLDLQFCRDNEPRASLPIGAAIAQGLQILRGVK